MTLEQKPTKIKSRPGNGKRFDRETSTLANRQRLLAIADNPALEAVLEREWPVFPCLNNPGHPDHKKPLTLHGHKDASKFTLKVNAWWTKWPDALIGVPMGKQTGMFCVDLDRKKGGSDGVATWKKLVAAHGGTAPKTMTIETPSTGQHKFYKYPQDGIPIRNIPLNKLAPGIEIKGEGGYVIAVGSRTADGGEYRALNDCEPADAPKWLLDMIYAYKEERPVRPTRPGKSATTPSEPADPERIRAALAVIPSDDEYLWWEIGSALQQALGDDGWDLYDEWSQKSEKYEEGGAECRKKWEHCGDSTEFTEATIFHYATEYGPAIHRQPKAQVSSLQPTVLIW